MTHGRNKWLTKLILDAVLDAVRLKPYKIVYYFAGSAIENDFDSVNCVNKSTVADKIIILYNLDLKSVYYMSYTSCMMKLSYT